LTLIGWTLAVACIVLTAIAACSTPASSLKDPYPWPSQADIVGAADNGATDNSSYNNSSIHFDSQDSIVGAPVSLSVGRGYYSSHPIDYGSGMGSRTQMVNQDSATSMNHDVDYAHSINGETEFAAFSSSNSRYGPEYAEYAGTDATHMMINENVSEGKISIGVLQGNGKKGTGKSAWKDPDLEIEEEYVGTYHIYKNMTLTSPRSLVQWRDGWLNCCVGGYFDMVWQDRLPVVSADKIFDYSSVAVKH
jgi:hypothetical protein